MRNLDAARAESERAIESVYLQTRGLVPLANDVRERRRQVGTELDELHADAPTIAGSDSGRRAVAALLPAVLAAILSSSGCLRLQPLSGLPSACWDRRRRHLL